MQKLLKPKTIHDYTSRKLTMHAWHNNVDDPLPGLAFKPLAQEARDATLTM